MNFYIKNKFVWLSANKRDASQDQSACVGVHTGTQISINPPAFKISPGIPTVFFMDRYDDDRIGSDEMDGLLLSLSEASQPGPSNRVTSKNMIISTDTSYQRQQTQNERLSRIDTELADIEERISQLKAVQQELIRQKKTILKEDSKKAKVVVDKGKGRAMGEGFNYNRPMIDWDNALRDKMKKVFGIDDFRLCQQGVCNANMDGRDIVCVMPTGGGKSLTYQLPALLVPGCTMVISPLISLITDQIIHLREAGVEAVMLTGSTPKSQVRDVMRRFNLSAQGVLNPRQDKEVKLCYVTPEKIAKGGGFMSQMERLANVGKLARIVIDEAHCVSQLGHDFRPDYQKLNVLRKLFPRVPILALSATCPPRVLEELLKILGMGAVTDGKAARSSGTVYFSSPLYRKNLHYAVMPKSSSAADVIQAMADYILTHHKGESGIVYCFSKKDAELVAESLRETTRGAIKTGVYHAEVSDGEKENLHRRWRAGEVKVVCATIAFGMGIDKANVRFVLHHSMSKSLDGFYQETGRAGRDGKDADCILYYRPQDFLRLSALTATDMNATQKLHDMLRFAQDLHECRNILFAKYFSASSHVEISAWSADGSDKPTRCGHCDNCTRAPETLERRNVSLEAWQLMRVADAVESEGGRATVVKLVELARGLSNGMFDIVSGRKKGRGRAQEQGELDLEAVAGGKIALSKEHTETLAVQLLLEGYLEESLSATAYGHNVYVKPGGQAVRLTTLTHQRLLEGKGPLIECSFRKPTRRTAVASSKKKIINQSNVPEKKRKRRQGQGSDADDGDEDDNGDGDDDDCIIVPSDVEDFTQQIRRVDTAVESDEDDVDIEEGNSWSYSLRSKKKPRMTREKDMEVVVLSSD